MGLRLGLRQMVGRDRVEVEHERYEDLRDAQSHIDLSDYHTTESRYQEAVAYLELATTILDRDTSDPELALPQ